MYETVKPQPQVVVKQMSNGRSNLIKIRNILEHLDAQCDVSEYDLIQFWNLSPDMLTVASSDGHLLYVNHSWTRILGWSKDELLSMIWFDLVHPDDINHTREVVGHIVTDTLLRFHNRYKKKLGGYVCLEWSATRWHGGKCYAIARPIPSKCYNCPEATFRFSLETEPCD